ncbi:MAG: cytochrome C oxidase subunit II [Chloroflexi bacterium]|nr:cytochrome C oxidase subunit II [Chloroflexota bacterium]
MSSLASPEKVWWKPLCRDERLWVAVALAWSLFMFFGMLGWGAIGNQHLPVETYRVNIGEFRQLTNDFNQKYTVGTQNGVPVVRPPEGGDVYLLASAWKWSSILELKEGVAYRIHLSSADFQHGFSLQPTNLNFQILPEYDYVVTLTPDKAGEYQVVCNEFCGPGHNLMVGKIIVTE